MDEHQLGGKEELQAAVRQVADEYLRDPNVTSVGIGYKLEGGKRTDELALQFTVGKKVGLEQLESVGSRPIPESITVNNLTLPTDVVERDFTTHPVAVEVEEKDERKRRLDPMMPGVSIGHVRSTAGTLGCLVKEAAGGETRVLSNWHVLQGEEGKLGDAIAQPGPFDNNRVDDNICGTLLRSFLGLAGDCAIASIENRPAKEELLDLGVAIRSLGEAELGDQVVKSGRTTGVTRGLVTRVHTVTKLDYGKVGEHEIGGFEISADPDHPAANGEISMGGDSGSAWMAVDSAGEPTEMMVGLHFAGETVEPAEYALACNAASVFEKLEIAPLDAAVEGATVVVDPTAATGYDPFFLPIDNSVEPPVAADPAVAADLAPTKAGEKVRHYTHFSLAMSASRRFCRWVAWNIDGNGLQTLSREGIDFVLDDAYAAEHQVDDSLYANNPLDRGHIARRADLLWGTRAEAERANEDSFFFTNITPQLDNFNQSSKHGLWGTLENAVFEDVEVDDLKICVLGGPIFKDNDFPYRGILVPRSFWKAIAYVEDGKLKAKAYVLTQDDLEAKLESLGLEEFKLFQISVAELEAMIGLGFGTLGAADTMPAAPEGIGGPAVRRIESRSALVNP